MKEKIIPLPLGSLLSILAINCVLFFNSIFHQDKKELALPSNHPDLIKKEAKLYYQGNLFKGFLEYSFTPNSLWKKEHYVHGLKEGAQLSWYGNGVLASRRFYQQGFLEGEQRGWHKNGRRQFKSFYKEGKANGISRVWYDNGNIAEWIHYKNGKEIHHKIWRRSGQIYANYLWKNNRPYGLRGDKACVKTNRLSNSQS